MHQFPKANITILYYQHAIKKRKRFIARALPTLAFKHLRDRTILKFISLSVICISCQLWYCFLLPKYIRFFSLFCTYIPLFSLETMTIIIKYKVRLHPSLRLQYSWLALYALFLSPKHLTCSCSITTSHFSFLHVKILWHTEIGLYTLNIIFLHCHLGTPTVLCKCFYSLSTYLTIIYFQE